MTDAHTDQPGARDAEAVQTHPHVRQHTVVVPPEVAMVTLLGPRDEMLRTMEVKNGIAAANLADNANALWVHKATLGAIQDGLDTDEARESGKEVQVESYDIVEDAAWIMRNYPQVAR